MVAYGILHWLLSPTVILAKMSLKMETIPVLESGQYLKKGASGGAP